MSLLPDETEAPGELPPLDRDEGERDQLDDEELGELLPPLDSDDGALSEELDTDTGAEFVAPPELDDGGDEGEFVFDPLELLTAAESNEQRDERLGLDDFDGSSELADHSATALDDEEGNLDFGALVEEEQLPELDADEAAADDDALWGSLGIVSREAELNAAPEPWLSRLPLGTPERCSALAVSEGVCAAASADLIWLDQASGTPVRTGVDGTRISSLALVGREPKIALCVTGIGRLFRRTRRDSAAERLDALRRAAELLGFGDEGVELCQLGSEAPHSVIARLSSGALLRSDDAGVAWRPIESPITAFVMGQSGMPLAVLSKAGARLSLSNDGGRSWEHLELEKPALAVGSGEAPLLAASGAVVALADAERGLVVSADAGRDFRVVPGCNNVTALTAGLFAERPSVWAAVYHEAADRTSIVLVDVARAEANVIGVVEASEPLDPDGSGERARVERMWWDGSHLWAVGGFGVGVWWAPSGNLARSPRA